MELEQMSSAELISLVRRQEQELAASRAALELSHARQLELESPVAQQGGGELLQDERAKLLAEIEHWKANHSDMVKRLKIATERPDLPVDRIPAIKELERMQAAQRAASVPAQAGQEVPVELVDAIVHTGRGYGNSETFRPQIESLLRHFWPEAAPVPAASVHDLETQQYIGARLRRVATAAGVTVDYGDDEFYYAGAFSILGDIARALDKTANVAQPDADLVKRLTHERDALGQAIADAALKNGMYNGEVPLGGPQLIMFAQHLGQAASLPGYIWIKATLEEAATAVEQKKVDAPSYFEINEYLQEAADSIRALATQAAPEVASVPDAGEWMAWDEVGFEIFPAAGGSQIGRTLSMQDAERIVAAHNASIRQKPAPAVLSDAQIELAEYFRAAFDTPIARRKLDAGEAGEFCRNHFRAVLAAAGKGGAT